MATTKSDVLKMIEALPDDASLDDIMAELYSRSKVDEGLAQLDAGESVEHRDVRARLSKWLDA